jgi:hypothetical protein
MNLNTPFNLRDKVNIKDLNIKGKVTAIYVCETGIQYNIRYFLDNESKACYFYEDELSLNDSVEEKVVGFKK